MPEVDAVEINFNFLSDVLKFMSLIDIKSLFKSELLQMFKDTNYPNYRVEQIYSWLVKGVCSFDEMLNIPKSMRNELSEKFYIANTKISRKLTSKLDGTIKYLFELNDGEFIESVLMKYNHGYTICISTQVGCKMGCSFCATGKTGFSRNLTASEMLAQIQSAQIDNKIRISNVVLMGMGEPLDNYDNVIKFLRLVSSDEHLNIGMRHISLSTCGIINKIYDLAKENLQLTLSISLHAPSDQIRNTLMPINRKFNIDELLKACKFYIDKTKRRISFEYTMISGVNDTKECAIELAHKLSGLLCHVNLIPVNSVDFINENYQKSSRESLEKFMNILSKYGVNATVRRTLGADINASCGQLKRKLSSLEV